MRRVLLFLLFALCAASPATAQQRTLHGIKGEDQRLPMEARQFPWSALGRLNFGSGHCSAALIGPRLIATAAHCLWNRRTQRPFSPSAFTFVAGWDRGEYLRAAKIAAIHAAPGWVVDGQERGLASRAHDWALMELEEPLGEEVGMLALGSARPDMVVAVAGYGRDKAQRPFAHVGCRLTRREAPGIMLHDCDAVQGESGGPVLTLEAGEFRLAAINVAVIPSRNEAGVATELDALRPLAYSLGATRKSKPGSLSAPVSEQLVQSLR